jgi:hypothetical protein
LNIIFNIVECSRIRFFQTVKNKEKPKNYQIFSEEFLGKLKIKKLQEKMRKDVKRREKTRNYEKSKSQQHLVFPGGLPSKYYPDPSLLNFGDLTRSGAFKLVWPLAMTSPG